METKNQNLSPGRASRIHAALEMMIRTMRLHRRVIERRIDGLGVHQSQHRMLMRLSAMGRTTSQKDIARALDVSPACVARTLKALSGAGLIEKAEGADNRRREISILPLGQRLIDDSLKTFREVDAGMFEGISDEDILRLTGLLSRMHQNLAGADRGEPQCEGSETIE